MAFIIAVQPDEINRPDGSRESYSDRWIAKAREMGHEVRIVDVYQNDIIERLQDCDGFMWRFTHPPFPRLYAKRLLAAAEHGLGLVVFPDWKTAWHYDDKIAQRYLLEAAGIPIAKTWIFWNREGAIDFCSNAQFPLVIKLAGGASSQNVRLLNDFNEAKYWINQLFYRGLFSLDRAGNVKPQEIIKRLKPAVSLLLKGRHPNPGPWYELQKNYLMVQELLPDNPYDTRVTVIGNRAFAFRRFNRPKDFRASGSGNFDTDPEAIDLKFVRLGFKTARALGTQSVAIDGLYFGQECVTTEISYSYASWVVHECPGHWQLGGEPESAELIWREGQAWPQDAIMEDFLVKLESRRKTAIS
jgi:glutathione synthase/RimK-type ligase-like ATP-grasp enzyme